MLGLEKHAFQAAPLGRPGASRERGDAFSELPMLERGGGGHRAGLGIQQAFLRLQGRGAPEPPEGFTQHLAASQAQSEPRARSQMLS